MRPIACLDLETTGLDPLKDRVISIGITPICPLTWTIGATEEFIFNPGIPISAESSAIHGYTNADLVHHPSFDQLAKVVFDLLKGHDLAGFNMLGLDLPLLWMEFDRCGLRWEPLQCNLLDAGTLFKKREERSLTAAVQFYLGRDHTDAHGAGSDSLATAQVLVEQLKRYKLIDKPVEVIELETLFARPLDVAGKIVVGPDGRPTYAFGQKVKGKAVVEDIGFAEWMLRTNFHPHTLRVVSDLVEEAREDDLGENDWFVTEEEHDFEEVPVGDSN